MNVFNRCLAVKSSGKKKGGRGTHLARRWKKWKLENEGRGVEVCPALLKDLPSEPAGTGEAGIPRACPPAAPGWEVWTPGPGVSSRFEILHLFSCERTARLGGGGPKGERRKPRKQKLCPHSEMKGGPTDRAGLGTEGGGRAGLRRSGQDGPACPDVATRRTSKAKPSPPGRTPSLQ